VLVVLITPLSEVGWVGAKGPPSLPAGAGDLTVVVVDVGLVVVVGVVVFTGAIVCLIEVGDTSLIAVLPGTCSIINAFLIKKDALEILEEVVVLPAVPEYVGIDKLVLTACATLFAAVSEVVPVVVLTPDNVGNAVEAGVVDTLPPVVFKAF
jgi:hypothetical protein